MIPRVVKRCNPELLARELPSYDGGGQGHEELLLFVHNVEVVRQGLAIWATSSKLRKVFLELIFVLRQLLAIHRYYIS